MFDEVVYPTSGYAYLTLGDYRMNAEHPPLLKLWTGLAWLGTGLSSETTPGWVERNQWRYGRAMLFRGETDPGQLLFRARLMIALLSVVTGAAVFGVANRMGGSAAALAGLGLWVFDPLVVVHSGLATTDIGAAALYFLAALAMVPALRGRGWRACVVAGALTGLALAAKFSTITLLGVLVAVAVASRWEEGFRTTKGSPAGGARETVTRGAVVILVAAVVLTVCYGPAGPRLYLDGLGMLGYHTTVGHPAYAFGQYTWSGWWWFFPAAWLVKTPIPILVASSVGVLLLGIRLRRRPALVTAALVAPLLVWGTAMASSLNLGVRHLLPATPFLAVAGGLAAGWAWKAGRMGRAIVLVGLLHLATGTLLVHPDEFAYANEIAGGPERTWRHLADSNVDWGQDLPALAREVNCHPLRRLYLGYFGTAEPAAHGLGRYVSIPAFGMAERRLRDGPDPEGREWIAISVTNLLEVYSERRRSYAWLRERRFTSFPGHSIALYDITGDGEAHRLLGRSALDYGDAEAAEIALRRAVELHPKDGRARLELARALAALGQAEEAATQCESATQILGEAATRGTCDPMRAALGDSAARAGEGKD